MYRFTISETTLIFLSIGILVLIALFVFMIASVSFERKRVRKLDKVIANKNQELTDLSRELSTLSEKESELKKALELEKYVPDSISVDKVFGNKPYLVIPRLAFEAADITLQKKLLWVVSMVNHGNSVGLFTGLNYYVSMRGSDGRLTEDKLFNPKKNRVIKKRK